jgi:hypothetical protein
MMAMPAMMLMTTITRWEVARVLCLSTRAEAAATEAGGRIQRLQRQLTSMSNRQHPQQQQTEHPREEIARATGVRVRLVRKMRGLTVTGVGNAAEVARQ